MPPLLAVTAAMILHGLELLRQALHLGLDYTGKPVVDARMPQYKPSVQTRGCPQQPV